MKTWNKGYVHVYTGNGKGKTTAALGLAIRALGANLSVFIGQFVKGMRYSEINILNPFAPKLTVKQFGRTCFIHQKPEPEDIDAAQQGFKEFRMICEKGSYDLIIADELNIALYFKLIPQQDVLDMIDNRSTQSELVITGRYAPAAILDRADLITEMNEVRHYYTNGIEAREGIES